MAKRKPASSRSRRTPTPATDQAEKKSATVRKYYDLGLRALGKEPDGTDREHERIVDLTQEAGVRSDTIRVVRRFAKTYSNGELAKLLALRDPDGEPLGWYIVRVLLQVKDKAERTELQKRVAAERWSRQDLRDEIDARHSVTRRPELGGGLLRPGPHSRPCAG